MATSGTQSISGLLGGSANTQTSTSSSTDATGSALNVDSFMKMFLTQLKCQDPSNPMQSYELSSQLAQFSSLAKLTEVSSTLSNIQGYQAAINNAEMASLVGKDVTASRSTISVKSDGVSTLDYTLGSASTVTISIIDADGNVVHTENKGAQNAGSYNIAWDGKDTKGNKVPDGTYICQVQAVDGSGNKTNVQPTIHGQVYSLSLDPANPYYTLSGADGTKVAASDIVKIGTQSN
jgi:flagellar basal-body rod modification protein FlgD